MSTRPLRGIVIGCGGRGAYTIESFVAAGGAAVGIVDPSPGPLKRLKNPDMAPRFYDLATALAQVDADVAMICSPNRVHAEQFIACAERGLHVWMEKPIALSIEDAQKMAAVARARGTRTSIPFDAEEDSLKGDAIALYRRGDLGPLVHLQFTRSTGLGFHAAGGRHYAVEQPEVSGGWLIHHLCHMVDFAIQVGGPIASVFCRTETTIENSRPRQEEAITAVLAFRDGGTAVLTDNLAAHRQTQIAICGQRGSHVMTWHERKGKVREDESLVTIATTTSEGSQRRDIYLAEYMALAHAGTTFKRFLEAVANNEPSPVPLERGVQNIRVCKALQQSADRGQIVTIDG